MNPNIAWKKNLLLFDISVNLFQEFGRMYNISSREEKMNVLRADLLDTAAVPLFWICVLLTSKYFWKIFSVLCISIARDGFGVILYDSSSNAGAVLSELFEKQWILGMLKVQQKQVFVENLRLE